MKEYIIRYCEHCGKELTTKTGKQIQRRKRFCSQKCHDTVRYSYACKTQKEFKEKSGLNKYTLRGIQKKLELIELFGGKCEKCGYDKNIAAFDFHHIYPYEKNFEVKIQILKSKTDDEILNEAMKCMLLCSNCHRDLHSPYMNITHVKKVLELEKIKNGKIKNLGV
jgi:predicted HNH restriction endonuclease